MDDTDISSHVNNLEPEGLSARDDARIVDAEMTAFKSADIATVDNLSASITAMNQSLISKQFAESIRVLNRPLFSQQFAESIRALTRPLFSQQFAESIRALNRPLFSQQFAESIRALNRPLFSQQFAESIRALNRPLFSQQFAESIRALNRPLFSQQFAESIRALNRPLFSQQFAESIRALNRPLFSQQFAESIRALNRPLVNNWHVASTVSLNVNPRVVTTREEPQTWPDSIGLGAEDHSLTGEKPCWFALFDALIKDDGLRRSCRSLFADGYYALAVQRAYIYIDNWVSNRSGRDDKDGADLMRTVFSPKNPVLKLNNLQSRSGENQQQGYMHIFEGAMIGIRNPRVHEYAIEDTPGEALEMLVLANHLMRMLTRCILA